MRACSRSRYRQHHHGPTHATNPASCFEHALTLVLQTSESEVLVAPSRLRAQSIISQDGYGTMGMSVNGAGRNSRGSSTERDHDGGRSPSPPRDAAASRQRMAEISRTAGK